MAEAVGGSIWRWLPALQLVRAYSWAKAVCGFCVGTPGRACNLNRPRNALKPLPALTLTNKCPKVWGWAYSACANWHGA
jgi:hypothetical protein